MAWQFNSRMVRDGDTHGVTYGCPRSIRSHHHHEADNTGHSSDRYDRRSDDLPPRNYFATNRDRSSSARLTHQRDTEDGYSGTEHRKPGVFRYRDSYSGSRDLPSRRSHRDVPSSGHSSQSQNLRDMAPGDSIWSGKVNLRAKVYEPITRYHENGYRQDVQVVDGHLQSRDRSGGYAYVKDDYSRGNSRLTKHQAGIQWTGANSRGREYYRDETEHRGQEQPKESLISLGKPHGTCYLLSAVFSNNSQASDTTNHPGCAVVSP